MLTVLLGSALPVSESVWSLVMKSVLELPVYSRQFGFVREGYMLNSTVHWMPLIDAYSDYIPDDFTAHMEALAGFPTRDAFAVLEPGAAWPALTSSGSFDSRPEYSKTAMPSRPASELRLWSCSAREPEPRRPS